MGKFIGSRWVPDYPGEPEPQRVGSRIVSQPVQSTPIPSGTTPYDSSATPWSEQMPKPPTTPRLETPPWWIQDDYHADDREEVLRDPSRWGTGPSTGQSQTSPYRGIPDTAVQERDPLTGESRFVTQRPSTAGPSGPDAYAKVMQEWLASDRKGQQPIYNEPQTWLPEGVGPAGMDTGPTGRGSGDYTAFGRAWLASGGRTPEDLKRFVAAHPEYGAELFGSKGDKVRIGGRAYDAVLSAGAGGLGGVWNDITNAADPRLNDGIRGNAGGAQGTGYGDPSADLFVNEVLSRLESLREPINDPFQKLLQLFALDRVGDLGGDPYTGGEDAALRARYMDPLTQARDAAREREAEILGQRGFLPSSGLFIDQMADIDRNYEQGVARGSNDLAVRAIDERQRRADEQLQILGNLLGVSTAARQESDARGRELVTTAGLLPEMDERRLDQLLRASDSGQADQGLQMQALLSLLNSSQNQANYQGQRADANANAWGQYLGYIMQNWDKIFG